MLQSFVDSVTPGHKDAFVLRYLHCAQVGDKGAPKPLLCHHLTSAMILISIATIITNSTITTVITCFNITITMIPLRFTSTQVIKCRVYTSNHWHDNRYCHHPDPLQSHSQVAVVIEDTLFVHGGISDISINFVPDPLHLRYYDRATGIRVVHSPFEVTYFSPIGYFVSPMGYLAPIHSSQIQVTKYFTTTQIVFRACRRAHHTQVPGRQLPGHATPQVRASPARASTPTSARCDRAICEHKPHDK